MGSFVQIDKFKLGKDRPCFIIAEAGVNHNGDLELARQLIAAAKRAGADAVKFQTFKAESLVSANAPKAEYQRQTTGADESQATMIKRLELSREAHQVLLQYCQQQGILFLSSPFDEASVDFLDTLGIAAYKIPSGEITNLPFLGHVASKNRPVILSTGMATLKEVAQAVQILQGAGCQQLILLHCVSNYPADPADVNLRAMDTMAEAFSVPVGYSDHVLNNEVAFAAVARGACLIEKHFTLDRQLPGPDHQASLEPAELKTLVQGIRHIQLALGDGEKKPADSEADTAAVARKSLVAACDIAAGEVLTAEQIAIKRPGTGLPPNQKNSLIGKKTKGFVAKDSLFSIEQLR